MATIDDTLKSVTTVTFDCYGTLIDWQAGVESSLLHIFGGGIMHRMYEVFDLYVEAEKEVEGADFCSYRDTLSAVVNVLAKRLGVPVAPERAALMATMLPDWKPFVDTIAALQRLKTRYKLGVLSNIDNDLFAGTAKRLEVPFDFVVTAQDVGSYKPAHGHFTRLFEAHAPREKVLHVAQSLFHDGVPAGQLDLAYVWINRYNEPNETAVTSLAEYPDLASLADAAGV